MTNDYYRYGFSDLVVPKNVQLEKYATIKDKDGNEYDIECFGIEDEEDE